MTQERLGRLTAEHPGWFFSYAPAKWSAVPAPAGIAPLDALRLPGEITAPTAGELSKIVRQRYGWDDHCESCGVLARECGHRQPESEKTRYLT